MRRPRHIAVLIIIALLALLLGGVLLLQVPAVQTRLADKVLDSLQDRLDGQLSVGSVNILPFNTVILKDALLRDSHPPQDAHMDMGDTLLYARSLIANFSLQGIKGKPVVIRKASGEGLLFNLWLEPDRGLNIRRVLHLREPGEEPDTSDVFHIRRILLKDVHFRMLNSRNPARDSLREGLDYRHMDLYAPSIRGSSLDIAGGFTRLTIDEAELYDKGGYHVHSVCGGIEISRGNILLHDLHAIDDWSDMNVPQLRLSKKDDRMVIDAYSDVCSLDGRTLGYATGHPDRFSFLSDVKSFSLTGPLNDLSFGDIDLSEGNGTRFKGSVRVRDLSDKSRMAVEADVRRMDFTTAGLQELLRSLGVNPPAISQYAHGEKLVFKGRSRGALNDMKVNGSLSSALGELSCALGIAHLTDGKAIKIEGSVDSKDLNINEILLKGPVRECTLHAALKAEIDGANSSARIDTLLVDRLHLLGYDYSALAATGTFSGRSFDGRIICGDPNLNFLFQGLFNLSRKTSNALYKFYLNLGYADLHALGLDKREVSKAAATVNANYMRISSGELLGDVAVRHINLESPEGSYDIGDIDISSNYSNGTHRISVDSDFLEAGLLSDHSPMEAIDILRTATVQRAVPAVCKPGAREVAGRLDMRLKVSDIHDLLSWIQPGAYIADGSEMALHITPDGHLDARLNAQRIAVRDKYVKDLTVEGRGSGGSLSVKGRSSEISAGSPFKLYGNVLNASAANDHIDIGYDFGADAHSKGELLAGADLSRGEDGLVRLDAYTLPSSFAGSGFGSWEISPASFGLINKELSISGLRLSSGEQALYVDGGISPAATDTLRLVFNDLDMSMLRDLTGADIQGRLNGQGFLASPFSQQPDLKVEAVAGGTRLSGHDAGDMRISAFWDKEDQGFRLAMGDDLHGRHSISADALFIPSSRSLDALLDLRGLNLGYFSDFIGDLGSLGGSVSGRISAEGPLDALSLQGEDTRLQDVQLSVGMTGVTYHLDGPVGISDSGIALDGVSITDGASGRGSLSGGVRYERMRDMRAAVSASLENLKVFNLPEAGQDTDIYGNLAVRGSVKVSGPLDRLRLDVDAEDSGNGYLHVPIKSGTVNSTNLLTFKQEEVWVDPYELMMASMQEEVSRKNETDIRMRVRPSPALELILDLDRSSGNSISARGSGDIDVHISPASDLFSVGGDYNINSGNVHFSALGIANRDFSIKNGSSIKFGGDIMDSELNVDASYTTKVSLANLIADTTSVSTRRNVICGINISDKFRNPKLKFSIDVPDLDPTISSSVSNALNTEDKVQRQFLALLVTGNFLPGDQSGIVNNSNILYSNVTEIMAGQLNNILQRLDIPLDLGLNYQPNEGGTDIFDVAVSTQLFNNRVTVNGTLGNRDETYAAGGSDMAGDLDIGIKLDRAGAVQLNLFSHSADLYTNYLDNLQRNGVGIGYQREFRNLKDLWQSIFLGRKKREALSDGRAEAERRIIKIEAQDE